MRVCIHFDAFAMLIPNMDMESNISEFFENATKTCWCDEWSNPPPT